MARGFLGLRLANLTPTERHSSEDSELGLVSFIQAGSRSVDGLARTLDIPCQLGHNRLQGREAFIAI